MKISTKENTIAVTGQLLQHLKIKVSPINLRKTLTEHPDYPSQQAISDGLNGWNIPHTCVRLKPSDYDPKDMAYPFIAHLKDKTFILVHSINGSVHYSNEKHNRAEMTEADFFQRWDWIVLFAEKGEDSGEANYKKAVLKGWLEQASLPFLITLLLACILSTISYSIASWFYFVLLGIKLAGISVSTLLLMHSIDANNPFVQNLCSLGKKNNCNAILKSDAAKVTPWLSWSEVGFFYFAGSLLCLLFVPFSFSLLAWLNLFALPYTFYSIYYQYKHKNWCILCCTVQALLWFEALIFVFSNSWPLSFDLLPLILNTLLAFLLPIAFWVVLKPFLLSAAQEKPLKKQLKKFKYNSDLFNQLLTNQPRYSVSDELMPIVLGNPEAETIITMVSNPFCGPCATAHKTLEHWLSERDDLQLKIIFTTANHDDDERTKVARHLTALSLHQDKNKVEQSLNDWYSQSNKKYESWAPKYPASFNGEMSVVTEKQQQWCNMAEIAFTPTILINGYKLIEPYRLEDIKYLI